MTDLNQALAELRRVTPKTGPESQWYGEDFNDAPTDLDRHIATILNAAASGDLIPKADADLAVAEALRMAAEIPGGSWAKETIRALSPTDALAELQALKTKVEEYDDAFALGMAHGQSAMRQLEGGALTIVDGPELQALRDDVAYWRAASDGHFNQAMQNGASALQDRALLRRAHDAMSRRAPDGISTEAWDQLVADMAKELELANA